MFILPYQFVWTLIPISTPSAAAGAGPGNAGAASRTPLLFRNMTGRNGAPNAGAGNNYNAADYTNLNGGISPTRRSNNTSGGDNEYAMYNQFDDDAMLRQAMQESM